MGHVTDAMGPYLELDMLTLSTAVAGGGEADMSSAAEPRRVAAGVFLEQSWVKAEQRSV